MKKFTIDLWMLLVSLVLLAYWYCVSHYRLTHSTNQITLKNCPFWVFCGHTVHSKRLSIPKSPNLPKIIYSWCFVLMIQLRCVDSASRPCVDCTQFGYLVDFGDIVVAGFDP